ncbi:unnamed protein product [Umbelopsis vinacea]
MLLANINVDQGWVNVTAKQVRNQLEKEYNISLRDHKKSIESLVIECFYELQDQQSCTSMQDHGNRRDSNILLPASASSPETNTISDDGNSILMNMQLPEYDPYQHMNAYLHNFSLPAAQFVQYTGQAGTQSQLIDIQDDTINFMPQLQQQNQQVTDREFQSQSLDSFSTALSRDPITNFSSQATTSYLPYYSFSPSTQHMDAPKAFDTQQYSAEIQTYAQLHQAYDANYRFQQMKQRQMVAPILARQYTATAVRWRISWEWTVVAINGSEVATDEYEVKYEEKGWKTAAIIDPNAPPKPKRNTGLNKPLVLSSSLAAFTGVSELSRPEVVKKLWKYIKENDLQDPADRRYILCDVELKKIFTQDRVNSFAMNRDLSAHLSKKTDSQPSTTTPVLEEAEPNYTLASSTDMTPQTPVISGEEEDLADRDKARELNDIEIEQLVQSMTPVTS